MPKGIGRPNDKKAKAGAKVLGEEIGRFKKMSRGEGADATTRAAAINSTVASPRGMKASMALGERNKKAEVRATAGKSGKLTGTQSKTSTERSRLK